MEDLPVFLTEHELDTLKDGCKHGGTLQQLREHTYKLNNVPEGFPKKIINVEIDQLLLLQKKIKPFPRSKVMPAEMLYVLAYILEETEISNIKKSETNYRRLSIRFIKRAVTSGVQKAMLAYPEMQETLNRINYWWNYANKVYDK